MNERDDLVDLSVGDTIIAYDFPFNKDYYRVGEIEQFVDDFMICRTIESKLPVDEDVKETFATKIFGFDMFDADFDRIVFVKHPTTH